MKQDHSASSKSKASAPRLRGWKRWAFPLIAMLFIPALFFLLLEGGLRLINYGFPTQFLIKREVQGETVFTDNRQYGWRFFPKQVARRPADIVLPAKKGENTFRVFVLGESAAMGDPDNAFGIPRMLEAMLEERFPDKKIEVINAAMTGISSHIIQDISKACAKFEPDCFVVYMGNNEAIGPYGPGTVFASFSRNLALTRLSIDARSLKTSQLIDGVIRSRSKSEEPGGWGGLRVFMKSQMHPTDERMAILGEHFEANLKTICEVGHAAGAKLVLCTVASSTADCSPFASLNDPTLTVDEKKSWDAKWALGNQLESRGKTEAALQAYAEAEGIDSSYAELHFRKGKLLAGLGRAAEARESFTKARDLDALRFRTATDLNNRVKELAESLPHAALADVVKAMEVDSNGNGIGSDHFVDHVHFNFHGNYIAAREIFESVSRFVPSKNGAAPTGTALTEAQCAERLAFTRWDDLVITEHMIQRFKIPPFDTKSDFKERISHLEARMEQLANANSPTGLREAVASYGKAVQRKKNDAEFLRSLAELYMELEQAAEEIQCREALYGRFPYDQDRKAFLAEAQARGGKAEEAEKLAREVLKVEPTQVVARLALATALEKRGVLQEATVEYKEVLRLRPDMGADIQGRIARIERGGPNPVLPSAQPMQGNTGTATAESKRQLQRGEELLTNGKTEEGINALRTAIRLNPQLAEAYLVLAGTFVHMGKTDEAIAVCKDGLRARPDFVDLHSNLGALLTDLNRLDEAKTHLEAAVRLNPNHDDARLNLALNLMRNKQTQQALTHFETFIQKHPNEAEIHLQMGILYEESGNWEKASGSYRHALRVHPANEQYQSYLAWLLATSPQENIRNAAEALRLAQSATSAPTKQAYSLDTLAAALAENGRFDEAIRTAEEALVLARNGNDTETADAVTKRIALYKSNQPYRSVAVTSVP